MYNNHLKNPNYIVCFLNSEKKNLCVQQHMSLGSKSTPHHL
jgi:hypothetical protein